MSIWAGWVFREAFGLAETAKVVVHCREGVASSLAYYLGTQVLELSTS